MERTDLYTYIAERKAKLKEASKQRKFEFSSAATVVSDNALVEAFDHFIRDVFSKAREARDKYKFPEWGWATPDWERELQRGIAEHVQKGDPRDVAVYAMFAWFHGWSTALPVRGFHDEVERIMDAIEWELAGPGESHLNHGQVEATIRKLVQDNARLIDETYRWSAAVKKLEAERGNFQSRVATWMQETFGPVVSADFQERGFRFGEEAIELLQANGTTKEEVLKLVDYVYGRPVGDLAQEVGGTMVTLAALCEARGINLAVLANDEQSRVEQPQVRAKIQQKQEAKRAQMIATPLPGQV